MTESSRERFSYASVALALGVLGVVAAGANAFIQDDAFISFVYARAWVEGEGLTWFGEHIEGYTNFLWVAWIALGMKVGASPILTAHLGSLFAYACVLWMTWRLSPWVSPHPWSALLALLFLSTNGTVLAYGTSGLETMLQTALLLAVGAGAFHPQFPEGISARQRVVLSICAGLALLTRLDSAIFLMGFGLLYLRKLTRSPKPLAPFLQLVGPAAAILGVWLLWKLSYYGDIFPNTYTAKVGTSEGMAANGWLFLFRYFEAYWLWILLIPGIALMLVRPQKEKEGPLRWVLFILALWCGYVASVGGDFMEFRFLVPASPWLALALGSMVMEVLAPRLESLKKWFPGFAAAVFVVGSMVHGVTATPTPDFALDTVDGLRTFYGTYPDENWDRIGTPLGEALEDIDPLIALHAVGAIPYYSGLRTLDMFGLTDREVARTGIVAPPSYTRPGHRRFASLELLQKRGVNLVLGAPTVLPTSFLLSPEAQEGIRRWPQSGLWFQSLSNLEVRVLAIPISTTESLLTWYLTPDPALDQRIDEKGWPSWTFRL